MLGLYFDWYHFQAARLVCPNPKVGGKIQKVPLLDIEMRPNSVSTLCIEMWWEVSGGHSVFQRLALMPNYMCMLTGLGFILILCALSIYDDITLHYTTKELHVDRQRFRFEQIAFRLHAVHSLCSGSSCYA